MLSEKRLKRVKSPALGWTFSNRSHLSPTTRYSDATMSSSHRIRRYGVAKQVRPAYPEAGRERAGPSRDPGGDRRAASGRNDP